MHVCRCYHVGVCQVYVGARTSLFVRCMSARTRRHLSGVRRCEHFGVCQVYVGALLYRYKLSHRSMIFMYIGDVQVLLLLKTWGRSLAILRLAGGRGGRGNRSWSTGNEEGKVNWAFRSCFLFIVFYSNFFSIMVYVGVI